MNFQTLLRRASVALVFFIVNFAIVFGDSSGRSGRTATTSAGCGGGCHGSSSGIGTTVTASSASGSFTVAPGSTTSFTVVIAHATLPSAGVDIAVKTDLTGTTNVGTLAPASGSGLQLSTGELVHSTPKALSSGQVSFTFTWTAPSTAGSYYLRAIGNAVNLNGVEDSGDIWNWLSPITITVAATPIVTVNSPNGGENWMAGTVQNITWTAANFTNAKIELSANGGSTYSTLVASTTASLGSWQWAIPSNQTLGSNYKVRISNASSTATNDVSNNAFNIIVYSLTSPIPSSPGNSAQNIPLNTTFLWNAISGATSYQLQVATSSTFTTTILNPSGITTTSYPMSGGTTNTTYYWRVRSANATTTSSWSSTFSFTTIGASTATIPTSWAFTNHTGNSATIVIPTSINPTINNRAFMNGDAVGVFFTRNGALVCAGYGIWSGQNKAITVWEDNDQTSLKDGFVESESYTYKFWDGQIAKEYPMLVTYSQGNNLYHEDRINILSSLTIFTQDTQKIVLPALSWSMISSYIIPRDSLIANMANVIATDMVVMKSSGGLIFYPSYNINQIVYWSYQQGYKIYMNNQDTISVVGDKAIPETTPIYIPSLTWQIIGYLRTTPLAIESALAGINANIVMVKDNAGQVYYPDFAINQIGSMMPGEGYRIYCSAASTLTYPSNSPRISAGTTSPELIKNQIYKLPTLHSGENSVLLVKIEGAIDGDEIGVWNAKGQLVGSGVVSQKICTITVWGADQTAGISGANEGDLLMLKYWTKENAEEKAVIVKSLLNGLTNVTEPILQYKTDGITHVEGTLSQEITELLTVNSPIPFTGEALVRYEVPSDGETILEIVSMTGEIIANLSTGNKKAGFYEHIFSDSHSASGTYFVRLTVGSKIISKPFVIIR